MSGSSPVQPAARMMARTVRQSANSCSAACNSVTYGIVTSSGSDVRINRLAVPSRAVAN
jgi:hypothetical protein